MIGELFPPTDFYVLDGRQLLFRHFDSELRPGGFTLTDDQDSVERTTRSFLRAWELATDHDDYRPPIGG
nr:DUF6879 family protein [Pilimelia anulata]